MGIRVVPNETVPASIYRILLAHERRVITVRYHPAILGWPTGLFLAGLICALTLTSQGLSQDALSLTWLVAGTLFIYLLKKVYDWLEDYFVITGYRMLTVKGTLIRDVEMLPLALATTMKFRRTTLGRLLGYGKFIVEGVGQGREVRIINFVPYPEQIYLEICGLIFEEREDEDGETPEATGDGII
jgi:hypothetical protein